MYLRKWQLNYCFLDDNGNVYQKDNNINNEYDDDSESYTYFIQPFPNSF